METHLNINGACLPPSLLLFALGAYLLYQGYQTISFFLALGHRGQSTIGRVIGLQRYISHGEHSVEHTHPLFSYKVDGQWYEIESEDGLLLESFRIGQEMEIRFLPENPRKFTWRKTAIAGVGSAVLGLLLMSVSGWVLQQLLNSL
ncbi:hypothetical protein GCM10028805_37860 [Spirosoma harenae]